MLFKKYFLLIFLLFLLLFCCCCSWIELKFKFSSSKHWLIDWLIQGFSLALDDLKATGEFVILWRTNEKPVLKSMTLAVVSHCFFFCKLSMKLNKTNKQTNVWNAHASPLLLLLLLNKFQSQKQQQNWFCKIEIKYLKFESEVWNKKKR